MADYSAQIHRIKQKLIQAKQVDTNFMVFGSGSHKYELNAPATPEAVEAFERAYEIQLPDSYKSFILHIGNGGNGYLNSAAGPFYGIYPMGENVDDLIYGNPEEYLKKECILKPDITDRDWDKLTDVLYDENISDSEYYKVIGKIFSGVLPIGFQGCSYVQALVLNGPYADKVVNLEMSAEDAPKFTYEKNFLDWYERWLDEVISGKLITKSPIWFGYAPPK